LTADSAEKALIGLIRAGRLETLREINNENAGLSVINTESRLNAAIGQLTISDGESCTAKCVSLTGITDLRPLLGGRAIELLSVGEHY
jgi:hypothetical protein